MRGIHQAFKRDPGGSRKEIHRMAAKIISIDLTKVIKCDVKTVKRFLEACEDLLAQYQGCLPMSRCRLCLIAKQTKIYCLGCPWVWFTNTTCTQYNLIALRQNQTDYWTSHRIEQLQKTWIPEMKHYLKLKGDQTNGS